MWAGSLRFTLDERENEGPGVTIERCLAGMGSGPSDAVECCPKEIGSEPIEESDVVRDCDHIEVVEIA
jgi:hypothetical protein